MCAHGKLDVHSLLLRPWFPVAGTAGLKQDTFGDMRMYLLDTRLSVTSGSRRRQNGLQMAMCSGIPARQLCTPAPPSLAALAFNTLQEIFKKGGNTCKARERQREHAAIAGGGRAAWVAAACHDAAALDDVVAGLEKICYMNVCLVVNH